ncbi:MAG: DUF4836 family protein [Bacteroidaceae bacterium]|nr:DUF4836 family protein [Bacteroidaceae bacterium]
MIKKFFWYIVSRVLAIIVVVVVGSFFFKSSVALRSALPADVMMVGRVNLPDLMTECEADADALSTALDKLPATGIRYSQPFYFFASRGYFGAVVALENADELEDFLKKQGEVTEQRGLKWASKDGFLLTFDDDRLMLMGPATDAEQDALRNTLYACMKQKESESGAQSDLFGQLEERTEAAVAVLSLAALPEIVSEPIKKYMPKGVRLDDIGLTAALRFSGDRATLSLQLQEKSEKATAFCQQLQGALKPIEGVLRSSSVQQPFVQVEMGVRGERFLECLRQNPEVRTQLLAANMLFDLDMIVRSVDGDVLLTCPRFSLTDRDFLLQARVTDTVFLEHVASWNDGATAEVGVRFQSLGNGLYRCSAKGAEYSFGAAGQRFFVYRLPKPFAFEDVLARKAPDEPEALVRAEVDMEGLPLAWEKLPNLRRVALTCSDVRQWQLTLQTTEGDHFLKSILSDE